MYSQLTVSGDDAESFLQGQLTLDVGQVTATRSPVTAWCSHRGRVITLMRLLRLEDGIGLVLPATLASAVRDGLLRYRLRARVDIGLEENWQALAVANDNDLASLQAAEIQPAWQTHASVRRAGLHAVCLDPAQRVVELYGDPGKLRPAMPLSEDHWRAARIRAGFADLDTDNSEKFTPHMLNLDRLGAVSFDKGCYAGQEVVARTQHLGNQRRRLARYASDRRIAPGTRLELDGTSVGEVVSAADNCLLALLPVDLHGEKLKADGRNVTPLD